MQQFFKRLGFVIFIITICFGLFLNTSQSVHAQSAKDSVGVSEVTRNTNTSTERITDFKDEIQVDEKGNIFVTEHITVDATGQSIKHGIFRDFPTTYKNSNGTKFVVGFTVESVSRNGQPEPYRLESLSNGTRIRIGDANRVIEPGTHLYTIKYKTNRQIGFYEKFDELYWNVTGDGWDFPIDHAEAKITFPSTVHLVKSNFHSTAYTGPQGSTNRSDFKSEVLDTTDSNVIHFETTKALSAREGFTVKIGFPKGSVISPTVTDKILYFISDNSLELITLLLLILLLVYYSIFWTKVGKDPAMPAIYAQYEAPRGYTPAVIGYLDSFAFNNQTLSAVFVQMAVKKYLTITKKTTLYHFDRVASTPDSVLSEEELIVAKEIFSKDGQHFAVREEDYEVIQEATSKAKKSLAERFGAEYFSLNGKIIVRGVVASAIGLLIAFALQDMSKMAPVAFMTVWLSGWTVGTSALIYSIAELYKKDNKVQATVLSVFSLLFIAGWFFGFVVLVSAASLMFVCTLVCIIFSHLFFYKAMQRRTPLGMQIESEIKGFKEFLSMTEKDRMNFHNPPEKTPELFERFLPYAIVLGVDNKWANQFAEVFDSMNNQGHPYNPSWYHGAAGSAFTGAIASGFGSSFSSSVSSASTPASSSGGGGGSSGGGGGGGGGGGW